MPCCNQNQTYRAEARGSFMWSPKQNANGARNQFYENMREVSPGDVVFSFCDTRIKAIGVVTGGAQTGPKPDFGTAGANWSQEGWFVPVDYCILENQIRPERSHDYSSAILARQVLASAAEWGRPPVGLPRRGSAGDCRRPHRPHRPSLLGRVLHDRRSQSAQNRLTSSHQRPTALSLARRFAIKSSAPGVGRACSGPTFFSAKSVAASLVWTSPDI